MKGPLLFLYRFKPSEVFLRDLLWCDKIEQISGSFLAEEFVGEGACRGLPSGVLLLNERHAFDQN